MTDRARANKESIAWEARAQYHGEPLQGPLSLKVELWWPDRRKHDIDNVKSLLDAMTGIVWEDDSQVEDLHLMKGIDKENPRVDVAFASVI